MFSLTALTEDLRLYLSSTGTRSVLDKYNLKFSTLSALLVQSWTRIPLSSSGVGKQNERDTAVRTRERKAKQDREKAGEEAPLAGEGPKEVHTAPGAGARQCAHNPALLQLESAQRWVIPVRRRGTAHGRVLASACSAACVAPTCARSRENIVRRCGGHGAP